MKNKRTGMILIVIGIMLLLLGMFFFFYNKYEDYKAGKQSEEILVDIKDKISEKVEDKQDTHNNENSESIFIDGYGYIGYITIPAIGIELPIMDEWDYTRLKLAPCRHFGSILDNNLVIAAHDYQSHFRDLKELELNDTIFITDMNGIQYEYKVEKKDILNSDAVDIVQNSEYDLVLYTCTSDGTKRVTIFCNRVLK